MFFTLPIPTWPKKKHNAVITELQKFTTLTALVSEISPLLTWSWPHHYPSWPVNFKWKEITMYFGTLVWPQCASVVHWIYSIQGAWFVHWEFRQPQNDCAPNSALYGEQGELWHGVCLLCCVSFSALPHYATSCLANPFKMCFNYSAHPTVNIHLYPTLLPKAGMDCVWGGNSKC